MTTKRGKEGKIKINFSSNLGLKEPINIYVVFDRQTAMDLASEAHANEGRWDKSIVKPIKIIGETILILIFIQNLIGKIYFTRRSLFHNSII